MARKGSSSALEHMPQTFFETGDDHLAAFLELRGCRRVGFGVDPESDEPSITHVFDDDSDRICDGTSAFVREEGDLISAARFSALVAQLRRLREDEELRLSCTTPWREGANDDA